MRTYKTTGIILKRRNIGEADRIITLFTKDQGKIQVKAKGVRKITSRRSSHVELLNCSFFTLYKGKTSMPFVIEAQILEDFSDIKSDLTKVGFAYHLCELIDGLCAENQINEEIFNLFQKALYALSQADEIVDSIHEFEVELLTLLGFWSNNSSSHNLDTQYLIENILERKLRSKKFLLKLS